MSLQAAAQRAQLAQRHAVSVDVAGQQHADFLVDPQQPVALQRQDCTRRHLLLYRADSKTRLRRHGSSASQIGLPVALREDDTAMVTDGHRNPRKLRADIGGDCGSYGRPVDRRHRCR
jgi:hypothetical protein